MKEEAPDHPQVLILPPLLWLITVVVSVLLHYFVVSIAMLPTVTARVAGIVCLVIAPILAGSAFFTMKKAGTNVNPGAPAVAIVRGGPFRFTRNPMYLALCLLQTGLAFLLNDAVTLLLVIPLALILHFGVILREESYLESKFGGQYLELKRGVRRWL